MPGPGMPPGGEARLDTVLIEDEPRPLRPGKGVDQGAEQRVGPAEPSGLQIHPRRPIERDSLHPREGAVEGQGLRIEEARLHGCSG
jgi:hypothetical protein